MRTFKLLFLVLALTPIFGPSSFALTADQQRALREFLTSDTMVTNIQEMDMKGKLKAELTAKPWAGYYWPDGFGGLVDPYRDPKFPHSTIRMMGSNSGFNRTLKWLKNSFRGPSLKANIYSLSEEQVDQLSPAEKYDLLFSNTDYTLTHSILNDIQSRLKGQRIAGWEGICNGWSLAALNVDRPMHTITVKSFSGRPINFYPHDIMALSALLYARSPVNNWDWYVRDQGGNRTALPFNTPNPEQVAGSSYEPIWLKFLGRRCYEHTDKSGCGDLNPAMLHLAIVNSIGYQDSGFVMDKHKDPTIANVTVFGYKAKLSSPKNGKEASLLDAIQVVDGVKQVGVEMELEYQTELHPFNLKEKDIKHYWDLEKSKVMKFSYTLILDEKNNIVDGKWTNRVITKYPDFLWKLPKGSMAFSGYEGNLNMFDWNVGSTIPNAWLETSTQSSKSLQPLGVVVYNLVNQSRR